MGSITASTRDMLAEYQKYYESCEAAWARV